MNYKSATNDSIDIGGYRHITQDDDNPYWCLCPKAATTETFHKPDGTNMIVATGKKARIIYVQLTSGLSTVGEGIQHSDDEGTTNRTWIWQAMQAGPFSLIHPWIPAGQYINKEGGANADYAWIYVLEVNA